MAFGQIYKVLEMEPLPSNKQPQKYPWCDKEGGRSCLSLLTWSVSWPALGRRGCSGLPPTLID